MFMLQLSLATNSPEKQGPVQFPRDCNPLLLALGLDFKGPLGNNLALFSARECWDFVWEKHYSFQIFLCCQTVRQTPSNYCGPSNCQTVRWRNVKFNGQNVKLSNSERLPFEILICKYNVTFFKDCMIDAFYLDRVAPLINDHPPCNSITTPNPPISDLSLYKIWIKQHSL